MPYLMQGRHVVMLGLLAAAQSAYATITAPHSPVPSSALATAALSALRSAPMFGRQRWL